MGYISTVRNVNEAQVQLMMFARRSPHRWRSISPRGLHTMEWNGVFVTEYERPMERVLFSPARDANPFFHFFESLWILDGREDVEFLAQFNPKMRDYSDNGLVFHAPYGKRLRGHFAFDQISKAIELLRVDHATRQVVLTIWDPRHDLGATTKDMPCNDMIFLKIRNGALQMTVSCRSNDAIWGAYGANTVQFSMIHEFIARAVGVEVGVYTQISDSFHIYTENEKYKALLAAYEDHHSVMEETHDPYAGEDGLKTFPIMQDTNYQDWLGALNLTLEDPSYVNEHPNMVDPFFSQVVVPLWQGWLLYKQKNYVGAQERILFGCEAEDWRVACLAWLERRGK